MSSSEIDDGESTDSEQLELEQRSDNEDYEYGHEADAALVGRGSLQKPTMRGKFDGDGVYQSGSHRYRVQSSQDGEITICDCTGLVARGHIVTSSHPTPLPRQPTNTAAKITFVGNEACYSVVWRHDELVWDDGDTWVEVHAVRRPRVPDFDFFTDDNDVTGSSEEAPTSEDDIAQQELEANLNAGFLIDDTSEANSDDDFVPTSSDHGSSTG